jgi:chaperonin GroEL
MITTEAAIVEAPKKNAGGAPGGGMPGGMGDMDF